MARMLGRVLLTPTGGTPIALVDNCWTHAQITRPVGPSPSSGWQSAYPSDCEECCPECLEPVSVVAPSESVVWWSSTIANPAVDEFFGIYATSITLESALSSRRRGDTTLTKPAYTPRRLEISGWMISASQRGTQYAWEALTRFLGPTGCEDGFTCELQAFCNSETATTPPVLETWMPDAPPPLVDDPGVCGPCERQDPTWVPARLPAPSTVFTGIVDSGARKVLRVKLVSIDSDDTTELQSCEGDQVTLIFEVLSDDAFGDPVNPSCLISGFSDNAAERCRPYNWEWACRTVPVNDTSGCPPDPTIVTPAAFQQVTSAASVATGAYCFPLWRSLRSCLAPAVPSSGSIALTLDITAGTRDIRNLMIEIWAAYTGWPDPQTCEGEALYRATSPVATGQVSWLPAGGRLIVDGARRTIQQSCFGQTPVTVASTFSSPTGAWSFPELAAGARHWIVVTADCMNVNDRTSVLPLLTPKYRA